MSRTSDNLPLGQTAKKQKPLTVTTEQKTNKGKRRRTVRVFDNDSDGNDDCTADDGSTVANGNDDRVDGHDNGFDNKGDDEWDVHGTLANNEPAAEPVPTVRIRRGGKGKGA
eukprot:6189516-Pleurochrysis_carterae.AAC.5